MSVEDRAVPTPATDSLEAMTLSEERLRVALPVRVSNRVRLIKYVESETVTRTVEVRREKLRVEELAEADLGNGPTPAAAQPYDWQQPDFEVILHEEQVEITKTVVAVEKIHVRTRVVSTDAVVAADLGQEQVELESTPAETVGPTGGGSR